jgi:hypothetical protein
MLGFVSRIDHVVAEEICTCTSNAAQPLKTQKGHDNKINHSFSLLIVTLYSRIGLLVDCCFDSFSDSPLFCYVCMLSI